MTVWPRICALDNAINNTHLKMGDTLTYLTYLTLVILVLRQSTRIAKAVTMARLNKPVWSKS